MRTRFRLILRPLVFAIFLSCLWGRMALAEKISVGVPGRGVAYFPMVAAMFKGFMAEEHLEPNYIVMRNAVIAGALMSGDLDYTSSGSAVFNAGMKGLPLKAIMILTGRPQHALVVKKPEIKSIKDLVGRPISVTTGSLEWMAIETFKKHGLNPKRDFKPVYTGEPAARFAALDSGLVDGAVLDLVGTVKAEQSGFRIVQNIAEITHMALSTLGCSERKIKENPNQVRRLIRATLRGIRYYMDRGNKDEIIPMITKWSTIDPKLASRAYDLGAISHNRDGMPTEEGLKALVDLAAHSGISTSFDFVRTKVLDLSLLTETLKERK